MNRVLSAILAVAIFFANQPLSLGAFAQNLGEISGTAVVDGQPLPNIQVRLRNVDSGQLVANMTTNERGEFRFTGLPVGNYVVETVAPNGRLLGTSARIAITAGALVVSGVTVSTSAAAAAAAGVGAAAGAGAAGAGAGAGAAAGAAAGGGFFTSTAGIITLAAVGSTIAGATIAVRRHPSPRR